MRATIALIAILCVGTVVLFGIVRAIDGFTHRSKPKTASFEIEMLDYRGRVIRDWKTEMIGHADGCVAFVDADSGEQIRIYGGTVIVTQKP